MKHFNRIFSISLLLLLTVQTTSAQDSHTLTISSWGDIYEEAQLEAYYMPFGFYNGIRVNLEPYSGGLAPLKPSEENGSALFDVIDMTESDAMAACEAGLLSQFDDSMVAPSAENMDAEDDFIENSFFECGVAHIEYATVIGYNDRAFQDEKPNSVSDIFDVERFPGKRALRREPKGILEWALISYGVPVNQVYDLLSTERGLRLVSRRMNQIRDHIVWWESGEEPIKLLASGEVVMAVGFNGRFFDARVNHNLPLSIIYEAPLLEFGVWGISKFSKNQENARKFIQYATSTKRMAAFSNLLPYSPTRLSAWTRIGLHHGSNVTMKKHMPNETGGYRKEIRIDSQWYAETLSIRQQWFEQWLAGES